MKKVIIAFNGIHYSDGACEFIDAWLSELKSVMLVCGAYGRSSFSRMLRKSFADTVIRQYSLPAFISHL